MRNTSISGLKTPPSAAFFGGRGGGGGGGGRGAAGGRGREERAAKVAEKAGNIGFHCFLVLYTKGHFPSSENLLFYCF